MTPHLPAGEAAELKAALREIGLERGRDVRKRMRGVVHSRLTALGVPRRVGGAKLGLRRRLELSAPSVLAREPGELLG